MHRFGSLRNVTIVLLDLCQPVGQPSSLNFDVDLAGGDRPQSLYEPNFFFLRRHLIAEDPLAALLNSFNSTTR